MCLSMQSTVFIAICIMHANRAQSHAKAVAKSTGCKGRYSLMRLLYHNHVEQTTPDAMHTVKDCIEKLLYLLIGKYCIAIYIYMIIQLLLSVCMRL